MSNRLEEELDEILKKADDLPASSPKPAGKGGKSLRLPEGLLRVLSPGKLLLAGVALLLSALVLQSVASGLVGLFFWTGLILGIAAYALFVARSGSSSTSRPRWRGRPVDRNHVRGPSWLDRLRRRGG